MHCTHCQARMTERDCVDPEATGLMWMKGWQCGCGDSLNRWLGGSLLEPDEGQSLGGEALTRYAL